MCCLCRRDARDTLTQQEWHYQYTNINILLLLNAIGRYCCTYTWCLVNNMMIAYLVVLGRYILLMLQKEFDNGTLLLVSPIVSYTWYYYAVPVLVVKLFLFAKFLLIMYWYM